MLKISLNYYRNSNSNNNNNKEMPHSEKPLPLPYDYFCLIYGVMYSVGLHEAASQVMQSYIKPCSDLSYRKTLHQQQKQNGSGGMYFIYI